MLAYQISLLIISNENNVNYDMRLELLDSLRV